MLCFAFAQQLYKNAARQGLACVLWTRPKAYKQAIVPLLRFCTGISISAPALMCASISSLGSQPKLCPHR